MHSDNFVKSSKINHAFKDKFNRKYSWVFSLKKGKKKQVNFLNRQLENEKIVAQKERELDLLRANAEKESQEKHVSTTRLSERL